MQRLQFIFAALVGLFVLASSCVFTVSESQVAIRTQFREIVARPTGPACTSRRRSTACVKFERRCLAELPGRDLPHQRESRPDRRFLHQVAHQDAAATSGLRQQRRRRGAAPLGHRQGRHQERRRAAHAAADRLRRAPPSRATMFGRANKRGAGARPRARRRARAAHRSARGCREPRLCVHAAELRAAGSPAAQRGREGSTAHPRRGRPQAAEILSAAARDSLKIRGEGDSRAGAIYAKAYRQEPRVLRVLSQPAGLQEFARQGRRRHGRLARQRVLPLSARRRRAERAQAGAPCSSGPICWPRWRCSSCSKAIAVRRIPPDEARACCSSLQVPDPSLRIAGLGSIVVGLALLVFVRA
jgi:hypothetical protein